tara:strand:+ start:68 stop:442 length:375 start_codon:yes stop_codon:yes gene_type:complete
MSDNQDSSKTSVRVSIEEFKTLLQSSKNPKFQEIRAAIDNLEKSIFGHKHDMELQKVREEKTEYPFVCEDCSKKMTKDEIGGQCCDHHTHEVLNRNGGYLCKKHYQRALENGGKCDQCCWWDIT